MKTFKDLEFKPHTLEYGNGKQASMNFENNYGVSVIFGEIFYSNGIDTYEIGILHDGSLTYDTDITDDVIGYQTENEISEIMEKVQQLT